MKGKERVPQEALVVSEESFEELLKPKLEESYVRALDLFNNCGPNISFDVTNVLYLASSQGKEKLDEVLDRLEEHYEKHLYYQDPEIRGIVRDNLLDINPTEVVFLRICTDVLGLEPNQPN